MHFKCFENKPERVNKEWKCHWRRELRRRRHSSSTTQIWETLIQIYIQRQTEIIRAREAGDMVFKKKADRSLRHLSAITTLNPHHKHYLRTLGCLSYLSCDNDMTKLMIRRYHWHTTRGHWPLSQHWSPSSQWQCVTHGLKLGLCYWRHISIIDHVTTT